MALVERALSWPGMPAQQFRSPNRVILKDGFAGSLNYRQTETVMLRQRRHQFQLLL